MFDTDGQTLLEKVNFLFFQWNSSSLPGNIVILLNLDNFLFLTLELLIGIAID